MFKHSTFGNHVFTREQDQPFLNATGDTPSGLSTSIWKTFWPNLYVDPAQSLASNETALTTVQTKDNSTLLSMLGIINSAVSGYFDTEASKASATLSQADILNAVQAYQSVQTQAQSEAKAKQTQTLLIAGIVGVVLLVGAYFVFRKK